MESTSDERADVLFVCLCGMCEADFLTGGHVRSERALWADDTDAAPAGSRYHRGGSAIERSRRFFCVMYPNSALKPTVGTATSGMRRARRCNRQKGEAVTDSLNITKI